MSVLCPKCQSALMEPVDGGYKCHACNRISDTAIVEDPPVKAAKKSKKKKGA